MNDAPDQNPLSAVGVPEFEARAAIYDSEAYWNKHYGHALASRSLGKGEALDAESFMRLIDEGRSRLGNMAGTFEMALREWGSGRCGVCARWDDERCILEC